MNDSIIFKGGKDGIIIKMPPNEPFSKLMVQLEQKLYINKDFFGQSIDKIGIEGRVFSDNEIFEIEKAIKKVLNENCKIYTIQEKGFKKDKDINLSPGESITKFYEKSVRSGQKIEAENNLVIIGDVNPGAEAKACGNIVVFGSVRGILHAGCKGDKNAFVVALNLNPSQIRIADIYTRCPDKTEKAIETLPEIAYINDNDEIIIKPFLSKK